MFIYVEVYLYSSVVDDAADFFLLAHFVNINLHLKSNFIHSHCSSSDIFIYICTKFQLINIQI